MRKIFVPLLVILAIVATYFVTIKNLQISVDGNTAIVESFGQVWEYEIEK